MNFPTYGTAGISVIQDMSLNIVAVTNYGFLHDTHIKV